MSMIKYALKCTEGHGFESWFQSADAFESLRKAGHVSCPACGATRVEKALMAPKLAPKLAQDGAPRRPPPAAKAALEDPEVATALKRIKAEVEAKLGIYVEFDLDINWLLDIEARVTTNERWS